MTNRKTYGRKDIGRVEMEGGWFPGESWAIEAHCGYWPDAKRLCLVYLQVAKLCVSVGVNLGPKAADVAEWGRQFEAMAKRDPKAALPKPSAGEIKAARAAMATGYWCAGPGDLCKSNGICPGFCYSGDAGDRRRAARAWLSERGIPIEAPEGSEAKS